MTSFILITSVKTLFPNKVSFTDSEWTWFLRGGHYSTPEMFQGLNFSPYYAVFSYPMFSAARSQLGFVSLMFNTRTPAQEVLPSTHDD